MRRQDRRVNGALVFDDLWVELQPTSGQEGPLVRASLLRRGGFNYDLFRQHQERLPSAEEIRALQSEYLTLLDEYYEDAAQDMLALRPEPDKLRALGRRVTAVLPESLQQDIAAALYYARRRGRGVRVTLEIAHELGDLLALPWELLTVPLARIREVEGSATTMLLRAADTVLVRQVRGVGHNIQPRISRPLAIQAFAATPRGGRPIDIEATRTAIEAIRVDISQECWYEGVGTLQMMEERLRIWGPQIVHLLCHGERRPTLRGARSDLLLTREDGGIQRVSAFDLAPVLSLAPDLQVLVLEACYAGTGSTSEQVPAGEREALESIALSLIRQGVPAVMAMQGPVAQSAAGAFSKQLYAELQRGSSLDEAIGVARVAMIGAGGVMDWALPVVYQGSGRPEPSLWYHRLADRLEGSLFNQDVAQMVRAVVALLAVALFVAAVFRWLLVPARAADPQHLLAPLAAWAAIGLAGPGLIALLASAERVLPSFTPTRRRALRLSLWVGSYMAYALAGLAGLVVIAALWVSGLTGLMPAAGAVLLGLVCAGALLMSYVGARSQARAAVVLGPQSPQLFEARTLLVILGAMLLLIGAPLAVPFLPGTPVAFLLEPAPAALTLSLALVSLLVGLRR